MKKTYLTSVLVILSFILIGSLNVSWGGEVTVFGPKTYIRDKGKPTSVTSTFTAPPSFLEPFLVVKNGDNGKNRVSSAVVLVNNHEVLGPSDFNQNVALIRKPLNSLTSANTINVELRSEPGSFITISVVGKQNTPPVVNAGPDVTVTLLDGASLHGTVSDDGLPGPLVTTWSIINGPGTVTFGNPSSVNTTAHFSQSGTYLLRLTANDGALSASDDITVTVVDAPFIMTVALDEARSRYGSDRAGWRRSTHNRGEWHPLDVNPTSRRSRHGRDNLDHTRLGYRRIAVFRRAGCGSAIGP